MTQINNLGGLIGRLEKAKVILPNLLNYPLEERDFPKVEIIAICGDCSAKVGNESQYCKCGAMVFPF